MFYDLTNITTTINATQLLEAAKAGDVGGVQAALDSGVPVNAMDQVSACTSPPEGEKRAGGTHMDPLWAPYRPPMDPL